MRATFSLFVVTISCVLLLAETSYATQADEAKPQQNAKTSEQHPGHGRASAKNQLHRATKANRPRPQQPKKDRKLAAAGNSLGVRQPSSNIASDGANVTASGAAAVNTTRVGRPLTAPHPSVPGPSTVPHRGPNPPTVGGAATLSTKAVGAINGSRVSRRP